MPNTKLTNIAPPAHRAQKFTDVTPLVDKERPQVGFTYLSAGDYCLLCLHDKQNKENCTPNLFAELQDFLEKFRKEDNIGTAITSFISHNKGKNTDKDSIRKIDKINRDNNIQVDSLIHLHTKRGGKGQFTLHGFRLGNVFEVVWFDPFHEIYKK